MSQVQFQDCSGKVAHICDVNCFQERLGLFLEILRLDSETNSVFWVKARKDRGGFPGEGGGGGGVCWTKVL